MKKVVSAVNMLLPKNKYWHELFIIFSLIIIMAVSFFSWQQFYPVSTLRGWNYSIYLDNIEMVSALEKDSHNNLLISQEFQHGKGRVISHKYGTKRIEISNNLSKPDGMAFFRGGVAFSQEEGVNPVYWYKEGKMHTLFEGINIEGLASSKDDRYLFAIEDVKSNGRILRFDSQTNTTDVLRSGLVEGEGVTSCDDGRLFYTEKTKGQVKLWQKNGHDKLILDGLNQPGFLLCDNNGLWITEDATHQSRVLLLDKHEQLHTMLSHLRSPQSIIKVGAEHYLVAEQGRNRILSFRVNKS